MLSTLIHLLALPTIGTALYVKRGDEFQRDAVFVDSILHERAETLPPIDTSPVDGIAGGRVANTLPPLNSFIGDLRPPVCIRAFTSRLLS